MADDAVGATRDHTHCDCGAVLTAEERHYYGHTCEACERRQMGCEDEADRQSEIEAAVAAARAQIVGWLREQERRWRHSSSGLGSSNAADVAAHYAQALHNAAASIESGAPERWAAEREGERG